MALRCAWAAGSRVGHARAICGHARRQRRRNNVDGTGRLGSANRRITRRSSDPRPAQLPFDGLFRTGWALTETLTVPRVGHRQLLGHCSFPGWVDMKKLQRQPTFLRGENIIFSCRNFEELRYKQTRKLRVLHLPANTHRETHRAHEHTPYLNTHARTPTHTSARMCSCTVCFHTSENSSAGVVVAANARPGDGVANTCSRLLNCTRRAGRAGGGGSGGPGWGGGGGSHSSASASTREL